MAGGEWLALLALWLAQVLLRRLAMVLWLVLRLLVLPGRLLPLELHATMGSSSSSSSSSSSLIAAATMPARRCRGAARARTPCCLL